jgi:hypothetical protein
MRAGYWHQPALGIVAPGCVYTLLTEDDFYAPRRLQRFIGRACNVPAPMRHLAGFALEAEHRARPITRLHQLKQAQLRIAAPGYDFSAAAIEHAAYLFAAAAARIERQQAHAAAEQRALASCATRRIAHEIAGKGLPAGAAANLAMMRQLLSTAAAA